MKKLVYTFIASTLILFSACQKKQEVKLAPGEHAVEVVSSMNASNYTYLEVSENGNTYWMAVPQMKAEKGETLYYSKSLEMKNFKSPSLNRTFDSILFVENISKKPVSTPQQDQQAVAQAHQQVTAAGKEDIKIEPVKGGETVAEIFNDKDKLAGKIVKIKGKVTKYNPGIMDRNWIHIQDGTQSNGDYDLLITSNEGTKLGDIITVEGKVAVNKDFGAGYSYKVMLEDAKILAGGKQM